MRGAARQSLAVIPHRVGLSREGAPDDVTRALRPFLSPGPDLDFLFGTETNASFLPSSGPDCSVSVPANASFWSREEYAAAGLARASHKAVVDRDVMWVIGGYVFNSSDYHMVKAYVTSHFGRSRPHSRAQRELGCC